MSDAHFDPLVHVAQDGHPDQVGQARTEAGRAIRDIGHALVGHHAPVELLDEVTRSLDDLTHRLDGGSMRWRGEVRRDGDEAVATLTLRAAHEGAPRRSHGGIAIDPSHFNPEAGSDTGTNPGQV